MYSNIVGNVKGYIKKPHKTAETYKRRGMFFDGETKFCKCVNLSYFICIIQCQIKTIFSKNNYKVWENK